MHAELIQSYSILVLMILLKSPVSLGWRSFKIILTNVEVSTNPKYLDVKVQILNKSESTINVLINTLEILDEMDLTVSAALENQMGDYTTFITKSLNFCKSINNNSAELMARLFYKDMLKHGKLFKECPIQKGTYSLLDYRVNEELLPSFLPEAKFKLSLTISKFKGEQIYKGVLYGRVDKSKGLNNLKMFSMG